MEFIKTYFFGEKTESLVFLGVGFFALVFSAIALWKWNESVFRGMAIPLVVIGIIQITVGAVVYLRTNQQLASLEQLFAQDRDVFVQDEGKRMAAVMRQFSYYKMAEIAFVLVGLILILVFADRNFWLGLGVGMLLQGSLMLSADVFAEKRGKIYIQAIQNTQELVTPMKEGPF